MKEKDTVNIIPSITLTDIKLDALAGRKGIIEEICRDEDNKIHGCWLTLIGEPYLEHQEWYIPYESILA
jgi:hypothetical protein